METEIHQLNEHNKKEYPPMHNGEFDISRIIISCTLCNKRQILLFPYYQLS